MEFKTEELRIKVPWGFVAAKTWGSSKNYPILVIHGLMDNASSFDRLISQLPKSFYYVCIDLPGHGYSSHFPSSVPLKFLNYVHCIKFVLDELNWKNCASIAHSLGASMIHFFTYLYPGIIKKYVSIDMPALISNEGDKLKLRFSKIHQSLIEYEKRRENFQLYSREEIIYALQTKRVNYLNKEAAEAMFERSVTKIDDRFKYNRDSRLKIHPDHSFNNQQLIEYMSKETVPILFIVASTMSVNAQEKEFRAEILEIMKKKKSVDFVIVEGNHDVHTNHPERLVPLIQKFLEQISSKL